MVNDGPKRVWSELRGKGGAVEPGDWEIHANDQ